MASSGQVGDVRLDADVAVVTQGRLVKGRGSIDVGLAGIRWEVRPMFGRNRMGALTWSEVVDVERVDGPMQHGVSLKLRDQASLGGLAVQADSRAKAQVLAEAIEHHILRLRKTLDELYADVSDAQLAGPHQRPLTLDELKWLIVAWGGKASATEEPGTCEGAAFAAEADECDGAPVYTFSASFAQYCAEHCRVMIVEVRRDNPGIDERVREALQDGDFPDDEEIADSVDGALADEGPESGPSE